MSKIKSGYNSELVMESLHCKHAELTFNAALDKSNKMNMEIEFQQQMAKDKKSSIVDLITTVKSEDEHLIATITLSATFILGGDYTEEFREDIFKQNTLAIMFPFVRSQMSILTSQPGMEPIILPAINTKAFVDSEGS